MEIVIVADEAEVGRVAAARIASIARGVGPSVVLGVATGSSPASTYEHLARLVRDGSLDLSRASAFALDEYVGLPAAHPESYASVIARTVTEPLGLDPARVHVPDGMAADPDAAAAAYDEAIVAAGVDVQLLGIGANGHIGFNEPGSSLASRTRLKTLAERTRRDNQRFFDSPGDVPRHCITQGIGTIMDARHCVLVAHGAGKADAVAQLVEGAVSARWPGTVLQLHRFVTVVVDEAAAAGLALADDYRATYAAKPDAQRWA